MSRTGQGTIEFRQNEFRQQLIGLISHFTRYEDANNQEAALCQIPVDDLKQIAEAKFNSCVDASSDADITTDSTESMVRDLLLLELLRWFKEEFFTWMDTPKCPTCSKPTKILGQTGKPTLTERKNSASRVELYTCPNCVGQTNAEVARFPRYNDPVVLLKSRTGRCGEWANCFALICRAMNFETRHVTDWTDHVWVEVFSLAQKRWLHCDPCENKCSVPLLYELGWGKRLSYIIAISQDDIQDVTWRYSHSKNHKKVLARRNLVNEHWLVVTIMALRKDMQRHLSQEKKNILQERLVNELVEFICPTSDKIQDTGLGGRESGSQVWRLVRQEIRVDDLIQKFGFVWKITNNMISNYGTKLEFYYDSVQDHYFINSTKDVLKSSWNAGLYEMENICRKEERDWNMVYLARNKSEESNPGKLSWKFELSETELNFQSLEVEIPCTTFHSSALISLGLLNSAGEKETIPDSSYNDGVYKYSFKPKSNVRWVLLTCHVSGGNGTNAWQHAQLFRESLEVLHNGDINRKFRPFFTINFTNSDAKG